MMGARRLGIRPAIENLVRYVVAGNQLIYDLGGLEGNGKIPHIWVRQTLVPCEADTF